MLKQLGRNAQVPLTKTQWSIFYLILFLHSHTHTHKQKDSFEHTCSVIALVQKWKK